MFVVILALGSAGQLHDPTWTFMGGYKQKYKFRV